MYRPASATDRLLERRLVSEHQTLAQPLRSLLRRAARFAPRRTVGPRILPVMRALSKLRFRGGAVRGVGFDKEVQG